MTVAPALLVVTGLRSEAEIAAGERAVTVCSGGRPELLRERLVNFAGMSGGDMGAILSFGLAGGLASDIAPGDVILATHVAADDARYGVSLNWLDEVTTKLTGAVTLHTGLIAGVDSVLTKSADKAALHALSGALAVDMESHIAAAFAREHNLPFVALRAISDPATRSLPPLAADALTPQGDVAFAKVIAGLLRQPGQLPALIAAGADSRRAFASLRRCRRLLGPLFGFGGADL